MRWSLLTTAVLASIALQATSAASADASKTKSATVEISYAISGGKCYPVSTATWSGYQVNRVRHIFHLDGWDPTKVPPFTTTQYPNGETRSSGTMTSQSPYAATRDETWRVEALFRSNGGAILARAFSSWETAGLLDCPLF